MPFIPSVEGTDVHTGWLFDRASALSRNGYHKHEPCVNSKYIFLEMRW